MPGANSFSPLSKPWSASDPAKVLVWYPLHLRVIDPAFFALDEVISQWKEKPSENYSPGTIIPAAFDDIARITEDLLTTLTGQKFWFQYESFEGDDRFIRSLECTISMDVTPPLFIAGTRSHVGYLIRFNGLGYEWDHMEILLVSENGQTVFYIDKTEPVHTLTSVRVLSPTWEQEQQQEDYERKQRSVEITALYFAIVRLLLYQWANALKPSEAVQPGQAEQEVAAQITQAIYNPVIEKPQSEDPLDWVRYWYDAKILGLGHQVTWDSIAEELEGVTADNLKQNWKKKFDALYPQYKEALEQARSNKKPSRQTTT